MEDEALVAADIQDRLIAFGYEVAGWVDTAEEAVAMATELRPDLVLMDMTLKSDMPGTEAASYIRTHLRLPVIYLTAGSSAQLFERGRNADPFGCITKPFEEAMLKANIDIALYKHRMERERDELATKLQTALAEVKALSRLLPICAYCRSVRSDQDYWRSVEQYVRSHTSANFTQCICPSCREKFPRGVKRAKGSSDMSLPG